MTKEHNSVVALPGGEWLQPLKTAFAEAGIRWQQDADRCYQVHFPDLQVTGVIVRTKDVPRLVDRPDSPAVAGFTGSDILVEAGIHLLGDSQAWEVPLPSMNNQNAKVYVGFTPNAYEKFGAEPTLAQVVEGVHRLSIS